jgi:hypothetical protein
MNELLSLELALILRVTAGILVLITLQMAQNDLLLALRYNISFHFLKGDHLLNLW